MGKGMLLSRSSPTNLPVARGVPGRRLAHPKAPKRPLQRPKPEAPPATASVRFRPAISANRMTEERARSRHRS
jgi:hypothetical protein